MLKLGEREIAKENVYAAKEPINIWDVNVNNIVISKLIKTKINCKYLVGIKFDKAKRPLGFIMPKISGYVKTFKFEDKINKLMAYCTDHEKLLYKAIKYKATWTKMKNLKNIELNALPIHGQRHIKTKTRKYGGKVYTNFRGLNVPEDDIKCGSFTIISIDSLLVYENKYYLQVYFENCAYKIVNKQMADYLDVVL